MSENVVRKRLLESGNIEELRENFRARKALKFLSAFYRKKILSGAETAETEQEDAEAPKTTPEVSDGADVSNPPPGDQPEDQASESHHSADDAAAGAPQAPQHTE